MNARAMPSPSRTPDGTRLAVIALIVMLGYFVAVNHVALYPWNNLRSGTAELASTLAGVIPFGLYIIAFARRVRGGMLVGMVHGYVWLALQIRQWWIPYLWGSTWLHSSLEWYTEHGYAETIKVLPPIGDHPIPDAQHLVLQLLSLIAAITMTIAYLRTRRRAGRPSAERPPPAYGDDGRTPRFHLDTRMALARASASGGGAIAVGAPRGDARSFRC